MPYVVRTLSRVMVARSASSCCSVYEKYVSVAGPWTPLTVTPFWSGVMD